MADGFVYEDAVKELQDIVNKLGTGNVTLDESLKLYTRGIELSKQCDEKLKQIEQKFSVIDTKTGEETEAEVK
ncbi:MAG: exodeoxyribonuclease VII small subunit [Saccharofermentans sp.]|jgi:exodeoxyribonuclease VII small subunit|nr:exodeoxyribonuclease VII small subunit [Saccharofermentans sp.]